MINFYSVSLELGMTPRSFCNSYIGKEEREVVSLSNESH